MTTLDIQRDPAGILEVGHDVEQLRTHALAAQIDQPLLEQVGAHSLVVEGNPTHAGAACAEGPQRTQVTGKAADHDVVLAKKRTTGQVEPLLASAEDQDVRGRQVGVRLAFHGAIDHEPDQLFPQPDIPLGDAVLQGRDTVLLEQRGHHLGQLIDREGLR